MQCLVVGCFALAMPRLAIVLVVIFSDYIGRAYDSLMWPVLGFVFMPLTTLAYAWAIHSRGTVSGLHLVVVILRDNAFGMIKWKQGGIGFENFGLDYGNPDFVQYAHAYCAQGHR